MRRLLIAGLVVATVVGSFTAGHVAPEGDSGSWDSAAADGHSGLVKTLSLEGPVEIIESSLALLPNDAGDGDALFLFPSYRPAQSAEISRVRGFVQQGGMLVIAADGHAADPWLEALGSRMHGLPALLPHNSTHDCVTATITIVEVHTVCLPSPATFANTTARKQKMTVSMSDTPLFLDMDQDGRLSRGDQGPRPIAVALQWSYGAGRIVAIADGDIWRNGVEHDENLDLARAIAEGADVVYVDSSGSQQSLHERVRNAWYRAMAAPAWPASALFALLPIGIFAAAATAQRIVPLQPHNPPRDTVDPAVEAQARAFLSAQHTDSHGQGKRKRT